MPRFVIDPETALILAGRKATLNAGTELLAPTLWRSQVLALLYAEVRAGRMERKQADRQLAHLRGLRIRLLGDRVLQRVAWEVADKLGWCDTLRAEYIALAHLQADALVAGDKELARGAAGIVEVASLRDLLG
jgi:predicted nucleic acid-binding protein